MTLVAVVLVAMNDQPDAHVAGQIVNPFESVVMARRRFGADQNISTDLLQGRMVLGKDRRTGTQRLP